MTSPARAIARDRRLKRSARKAPSCARARARVSRQMQALARDADPSLHMSESGGGSSRLCIRCKRKFELAANHGDACSFHGDILGNTMDYNLYEDHHFDDPSLDDKPGPRFAGRWACCQETSANAEPCRRGWHVTYDSEAELKGRDITFTFPN
eukprot:CAMPEP_0185838464 /NCGR_PEP_ID=MMETSP1353-20130828/13092_1 /TAXON_ID=1077150 /ORGANISM="Erythrolobus australicus, Strain CCMP3124" /LENGTH=152 /DNA_ID=CAMNT_0028537523 /DNA_START=57 /DNA_END=515 /DNA_ORIENTATION=-